MNKQENKKYYIVSVRYENFLKLSDRGFTLIGFPQTSSIAKKLNVGDFLIIYIGSRKSKLAAVIEIESKMIWNNDLVWDDIFPIRYKTRPLIILPAEKYLDMRTIKNGLSFINPEVTKFGVYFMNGIKSISEADYLYLYKHFQRAGGKTSDD